MTKVIDLSSAITELALKSYKKQKILGEEND